MRTLDSINQNTPLSPAGGPKTAEGKARSRVNAVTHGLTATTLLAEVIGLPVFELHLRRLTEEFKPASPTAEFLVRELARHSAALEFCENAERAVIRTGAKTAANLLGVSGSATESAETVDALLTGAVATEAVDRLTRYRRYHEKAWHQAYRQLQEIRTNICEPIPPAPAPSPPFEFTEVRCHAYLKQRLQAPDWCCLRCKDAGGYWLADRSLWQCQTCAHQMGIRSGTVMERSPLSLSAWFTAVWAILTDRDVSIEDLIATTKVARRATVRRMRERIRAALMASDASVRLAGLDRFVPARRGPAT